MLLVIIRKRNKDQDQKRYDRKYDNACNRKNQQRSVEFLIPVGIEILQERIDVFSSSAIFCSSYACFTFEIHTTREHRPYHDADYRKQQDHK